jgi:hypothetical protein
VQLLLGVAAVLLLAPAPARAEPPTMTFSGSVNALGVLTAVNLVPTDVAVPAGGQVRFVNSSGVALTLTVDGQSVTLANGSSRRATFEGGVSERAVSASATAFDLPVVGSLTSTTGTVTVAAAAAAVSAPPSAPALAPSAPVGSAPAVVPAPSAPPARPSPRGSRRADSPVTGVDPSDQNPSADDGRPAPLDGDLTVTGPAEAVAQGSTVTTVGDGRGVVLMILVATVLLGGIGTAAIRSIVTVRGARVLR